MSQLTKRIARLEGPGNGDEIVTIETHDGDFVTTHTELKYMLREIDGKTRGLPNKDEGIEP